MKITLSILKPVLAKRSILIVPALAVGTSEPELKKVNTEYANNLSVSNENDLPRFQAIGLPPSVLAIHAAPSVPIFVKKRSIMSIYGVQGSLVKQVTTSIFYSDPIRSFLLGNHNSAYQKVISTLPFSTLISSGTTRRFGTSPQKTFAVLSLEGTQDWAIIDANAIQAYFGSSLIKKLYPLPRRISRKLAKTHKLPSSTSVGLFKWFRPGFTLLSGRGTVGLVGGGNVYNFYLEDGEQAVVSKNSLLGFTVNGPHDIQNSIHRYQTQGSESQAVSTTVRARDSFDSAASFLRYLKEVLSLTFSAIGNILAKAVKYVDGTEDLVVITGPRNVLLQSGNAHSNFINSKANGSEQAHETSPQDFLSYVSIENSEPVIESTKTFKR